MVAIAQPPAVPARLKSATEPIGNSRVPIFVVGSGRSGSTLMASILHGHSALATGYETGFFGGLAQARKRILEDPAWPNEGIRYLMSINRAVGNMVTNYGLDEAKLRAALDGQPQTLDALLQAVIGTHAARLGRRRWVDQTPTHVLNVREIRELWPDAPIIYVLRDPRGVVASYLKVTWGPHTVVGSAYLWQMYDDAALATLEDDPNATVVRYEALLADPEVEVRRVCAFIGEAFEPAMLADGPLDSTSRPTWLTSVVMNASRVDAWRGELSAQDQARVEVICSEGMARHGYQGAAEARHTVFIQPYDRYVSAARDLLEGAADRGINLRPLGRRVDPARPILFFGRQEHMGWTDQPIVANRRSLFAWARLLVGGRLRGQPLVWVTSTLKRPSNGTLNERAADALARLTVPRAKWPAALDRIVPPPADRDDATGT